MTSDRVRSRMLAPSSLALYALVLASGGALPAYGQTLAQRVAASPDGVVELRYAARRGLCGDGNRWFSFNRSMRFGEAKVRNNMMQDDPCLAGPVRVRLQVERGVISDVKFSVGPDLGSTLARHDERPITDLGVLGTAAAADYLLDLASRDAGRAGGRAVVAAVLADSVSVWRRLLAFTREPASRAAHRRRESIFWLGQFAAAKLDGRGEDLTSPEHDDHDDPRTSAVFALSQLKNREGIDPLVQVARTAREGHIRRQALFWLADSGDPRAVALLDEILTR